ncbi:MAG: MAPEG family protein [Bacteriovoracaceae bacterium]|nr:MAPEG family protein [Bacteriovoracaceae bacterium]
MKNIEIALIGYVSWTLLLLTIIVLRRSFLILFAKKAANSFSPSGDDVTSFDQRLVRAHANCYENLPIFATLALFCIFKQYYQITDTFALYFLGARILQSIIHLSSTSVIAVYLRFTFFLIQIVIMIEWLVCIFSV